VPITPEVMQEWKARHAAVTAHLVEVHERWCGVRTLDPAIMAERAQEYQALVQSFEQFKTMPKEVWDELLREETDEPT
jgi:hypothetical protein